MKDARDALWLVALLTNSIVAVWQALTVVRWLSSAIGSPSGLALDGHDAVVLIFAATPSLAVAALLQSGYPSQTRNRE